MVKVSDRYTKLMIMGYNYFNDNGNLVGVTVIYNGEKISFDDFHQKIADKDGMYESKASKN